MVSTPKENRDLNRWIHNSKILEGRKNHHLGCDMEIQTLKSIIVYLQKELQGPIAATMEIPVIPNETDLREEKKEK